MDLSDSTQDGVSCHKAVWQRCGVPPWAWEVPELQLLMDDAAPSPEARGAEYRELLRTACSLRCLEWLWTGTEQDYTALVARQPPRTRLGKERFAELHRWVRDTLVDDNGLRGMRYLMLVHDAGKCAAVERRARGAGADWTDHDELLRHVIQTPDLRAALLPTFDVLDGDTQTVVRDVLGLECNLGQVMQGEAPAGVLVAWDAVGSRARDWYLVHLLLDLAGVRADDGRAGATLLTSLVAAELADLVEAMGSDEAATGAARYNRYLSLRATALGLGEGRAEAERVALTRIALMLQVLDAEEVEVVCTAWDAAAPGTRDVLRRELGRDGTNAHAFLPYYGPAFMRMTTARMGTGAAIEALATRLGQARTAVGEPGAGITTLDLAQAALGGGG